MKYFLNANCPTDRAQPSLPPSHSPFIGPSLPPLLPAALSLYPLPEGARTVIVNRAMRVAVVMCSR